MRDVPIGEAFRDDQAARQYLGSEDPALLPATLLPLRKWVQALYLTNAGELKLSADQMARLLDIPYDIATKVVGYLAIMDGTSFMVAIANRMAASAGGKRAVVGLVGLLCLLSRSLQLESVGLDPGLVGLG